MRLDTSLFVLMSKLQDLKSLELRFVVRSHYNQPNPWLVVVRLLRDFETPHSEQAADPNAFPPLRLTFSLRNGQTQRYEVQSSTYHIEDSIPELKRVEDAICNARNRIESVCFRISEEYHPPVRAEDCLLMHILERTLDVKRLMDNGIYTQVAQLS